MDQKQLREQENRCIQDLAPACVAACPAHVDVRGIAAEIAKGDFPAALKLYRKAIPFPGIISHICNQPCKATCLRKDLGGSVEIAALERACVEFGDKSEETAKRLPRKPKKVAVMGGGISGLSAAYDLARKGWGVVVYEASNRIGGGLWKTPAVVLPRNVIISDLRILEELGVGIILNTTLGRSGGNGHSTFLSRLSDEYDAIFLGIGAYSGDVPELKLDVNGQIEIDPLTFQTSVEKVFAGGDVLRVSNNLLYYDRPHSAILSLSEGRRAATSIDRFLQKVSLSASRVNEGVYTTRLYTNTSEILSQAPLLETNLTTHYTVEVAETEAARCIQCECLECVKVCEYLKHYNGYPKKYIREIYNNLSIVMGTRHSNQFINTCALCGLCAEVCPTDVNMGDFCHDARVTMVEQKRMPASAHDFALRDMAYSNGEKFAMARTAPGRESSAYVFFPGCQLSGSTPEYVEKMYAFLRETYREEGVGLMLGCCGAPAEWAGREDLVEKRRAVFLGEHEKLGKPKVILACSSCVQEYQRNYPEVEIKSYWEIYDQAGEIVERGKGIVAVQDACSTRYASDIQEAVRSILKKLGYEIEELELSREKTECCTYGGGMWLANKAVAEKMVRRRIGESGLDYVTYCAMCREAFARRGKRTVHLLDMIYGEGDADLATAPVVGYSQRQENRARLKEKVLREIWREAMPEKEAYEEIRLEIELKAQAEMEERQILVGDVQKVIENSERTGNRLRNPANGHYLGKYQPHRVTYWVEYSREEDGRYRVYKAYSHRMEIGKGAAK